MAIAHKYLGPRIPVLRLTFSPGKHLPECFAPTMLINIFAHKYLGPRIPVLRLTFSPIKHLPECFAPTRLIFSPFSPTYNPHIPNISVGAKHFRSKSLVLTDNLSAEMLRPYPSKSLVLTNKLSTVMLRPCLRNRVSWSRETRFLCCSLGKDILIGKS